MSGSVKGKGGTSPGGTGTGSSGAVSTTPSKVNVSVNSTKNSTSTSTTSTTHNNTHPDSKTVHPGSGHTGKNVPGLQRVPSWAEVNKYDGMTRSKSGQSLSARGAVTLPPITTGTPAKGRGNNNSNNNNNGRHGGTSGANVLATPSRALRTGMRPGHSLASARSMSNTKLGEDEDDSDGIGDSQDENGSSEDEKALEELVQVARMGGFRPGVVDPLKKPRDLHSTANLPFSQRVEKRANFSTLHGGDLKHLVGGGPAAAAVASAAIGTGPPGAPLSEGMASFDSPRKRNVKRHLPAVKETVSVFVGTFNMAAKECQESLRDYVRFNHHIYAFGAEESDPSKARYLAQLEECLGSEYEKLAEVFLTAAGNVTIHQVVYVWSQLQDRITNVRTDKVSTGLLGGTIGNKGGVGVAFELDGVEMLFVNAHFQAHDHNVLARNADFNKISHEIFMTGPELKRTQSPAPLGRRSSSGGGSGGGVVGGSLSVQQPQHQQQDSIGSNVNMTLPGQVSPATPSSRSQATSATSSPVIMNRKHRASVIAAQSLSRESLSDVPTTPSRVSPRRGVPVTDRFDVVFWSGDLNYRINSGGSRKVVDHLLQEGMFAPLRHNDQLGHQKRKGTIFQGYQEGPLSFAPTYKFDPGTDTYDTSKKMRIPAWTDRVLYAGRKIFMYEYNSVPTIRFSDHRPVYATFEVSLRGREPRAPAPIDRLTAPPIHDPVGTSAVAGDLGGGGGGGAIAVEVVSQQQQQQQQQQPATGAAIATPTAGDDDLATTLASQDGRRLSAPAALKAIPEAVTFVPTNAKQLRKVTAKARKAKKGGGGKKKSGVCCLQ